MNLPAWSSARPQSGAGWSRHKPYWSKLYDFVGNTQRLLKFLVCILRRERDCVTLNGQIKRESLAVV